MSGGVKKQGASESSQKNGSNSSERSVGSSSSGSRTRKRKRSKMIKFSDSDLEDFNLEDAIAIEKKLRKVAKENSLSDDEMRKLLQKFVKNEHILALVTLKAEDEIAQERREAEQRAIIITDTPSVPKLTRAKARELNKTQTIALSSLTESAEPEIAKLIKDDFHSDEDDEEYVFKEEDFVSDDDPNTTVSDLESNPCTPQTPLTQTEAEDSPVKFTPDGCFKVPLDRRKDTLEDLRIAARTRSKLCLQQTTIEDIQSEFVPPDVEQVEMQEMDIAGTDDEWMQFLNDFSKPLNANFVTDDDDPINDPEYVAAEKIDEDAEELRDVNISKKELTELMAELFEGLINEGVSLESIELDTPQKFLQSNSAQILDISSDGKVGQPNSNAHMNANRQLDFSTPQQQEHLTEYSVNDTTITSTRLSGNEYSFYPDVMSTPAPTVVVRTTESADQIIPVANQSNNDPKTITVPVSKLNGDPELIAVPIPGQPNCYQLAKVVATASSVGQSITLQSPEKMQLSQTLDADTLVEANDPRYSVPYDNNFTWEYISIKKHVYSEYIAKFERLRDIPQASAPTTAYTLTQTTTGFTQHQHDILQQQLRIHVQMLTQTYLQTYCHPNFWNLAPKAEKMLYELHEKASIDASFNAWNLNSAVELINQWKEELNKDTEENKAMMNFLHKEIELTNRNTRQVPRFAPRIMDVILNSTVFMYPEYLPRIPFTPKVSSFHVFSPAESQLIAIGLEKHLTRMRDMCERISKKTSPLRVACERLSKDTVCGKTKRRIWDHIKMLKKTKYYNPIKYFFDHNCAPPVEHNILVFENSRVLPLRERFSELPIAWQNHLTNQNNTTTVEKTVASIASRQAGDSYLQFVREALGEDIQLPEYYSGATQPDGSVTYTSCASSTPAKSSTQKGPRLSRRFIPNSVTINVNYIFGENTNNSAHLTGVLPSIIPPSADNSFENSNDPGNAVGPSASLSAPHTPTVAYNFDINTQTLQPIAQLKECKIEHNQSNAFSNAELHTQQSTAVARDLRKSITRKFVKRCNSIYYRASRRHRNISLRHRSKRNLQKRYFTLLTLYRLQLERNISHYQRSSLVQRYYRYFKALELYSNLLLDLKMACRNAAATVVSAGPNTPLTTSNSPSNLGKRSRAAANLSQSIEEEPGSGVRSKKANRQEENFRHMLLPDSAEDTNRKDAIYAFNFYEKVEEVLKSTNRLEDCKKFNHILKSFNPKRDKVADLYYQLEKLFLPDHPELAHVFLTFLLPSEAAEVGKFFEHFMITNMNTFINKLNVYFNKQPAQIRKIYNCLNQLAEDPNVTIKDIEAKILPLLKGNQFLVDWFMQQFPEEPPPDRLLPIPEHVNLKEVQNNQNGEFIECVTDLLDSPITEQQHQPSQQCQLRYINGRIFYGTKIPLPAKLSFMATHYQKNFDNSANVNISTQNNCIHGIREYGERRLAAATAAAALNAGSVDCSSDDNDKFEEDDLSKALVIDTTGEVDSNSSFETCDDATLRAHAVRLNPNYYGTTYFNSATSTPNVGSSHFAYHYPNAKKSALNVNEESKMSPRKNSTSQSTGGGISTTQTITTTTYSSPNVSGICALTTTTAQAREKRKSPTKKSKSPVAAIKTRPNLHPMVVIHEQNSAIACAKKLKSLIEEENECDSDIKDRLKIVARVKHTSGRTDILNQGASLESNCTESAVVAKVEHLENSDDIEFLPENAEVPKIFSQPTEQGLELNSDFADQNKVLRQADSTNTYKTSQIQNSQKEYTITTHMDSDEDCKLDIVASLATSTNESLLATSAHCVSTNQLTPAKVFTTPTTHSAWTRDEDKIILIAMKLSSGDRDALFQRIRAKLPNRTMIEIAERHQFLVEFLSKLQGK